MTTNKKNIIHDYNDIMKNYDFTKNTTSRILNKFEKVKLIGLRAEQIQRGAQTMINIDNRQKFDAKLIAKQELIQGKMPLMLKRKLPDGTFEYFRLKDMIIT